MGQTYRLHSQKMICSAYNSRYITLMLAKWILLTIILTTTLAWHSRNPFAIQPELTYSNQQVQYFDQVVDHFSYLRPQFWKQRYFVNKEHFSQIGGPVFLILCGQGPCAGLPDNSWVSTMAQNQRALVISLQHRYYGDSLPFRSTSFETANLKYLSSKQALKDIAFFIEQVKRNKWYGITELNKWITIGGSYSGALSAWFRSKYPHLTVGALASSAVILAVEDFKQFDEQIYLSTLKSGNYCVEAIQQLTEYAENQTLGPNRIAFQKQFHAQNLTSREFMFYWSDVLVFQVQYGNRSAFCLSLKDKTLEQRLSIVKPLVQKVSPTQYGSYYMSNPQFALENNNGARAWYYQCCTEFSYFQTYSDKHPMRSKMLTLNFYRKWCDDIYGTNTWPSVERTNLEYGGLHLRATNLLITNGGEDPWKWASLQNSYKNVTAKVADCTDCSHCKDLLVPNKKDPKELTAVRTLEMSMIKSWLGQK